MVNLYQPSSSYHLAVFVYFMMTNRRRPMLRVASTFLRPWTLGRTWSYINLHLCFRWASRFPLSFPFAHLHIISHCSWVVWRSGWFLIGVGVDPDVGFEVIRAAEHLFRCAEWTWERLWVFMWLHVSLQMFLSLKLAVASIPWALLLGFIVDSDAVQQRVFLLISPSRLTSC
jgi:hypothetical protein